MERKEEEKKNISEGEDKSSIRLAPPWGGSNNAIYQDLESYQNRGIAEKFIEERSKVHVKYIEEHAKSKRLATVLAVILLISAMVILLIAPKDKEIMSYWIGAALLVFSAGSAGYGRIWAKVENVELEAGSKGE